MAAQVSDQIVNDTSTYVITAAANPGFVRNREVLEDDLKRGESRIHFLPEAVVLLLLAGLIYRGTVHSALRDYRWQ